MTANDDALIEIGVVSDDTKDCAPEGLFDGGSAPLDKIPTTGCP